VNRSTSMTPANIKTARNMIAPTMPSVRTYGS
jgi:hypothetical protein